MRFHILGYNAVLSNESQPTFRRNIQPQPSGSKCKASMKQAASRANSVRKGHDLYRLSRNSQAKTPVPICRYNRIHRDIAADVFPGLCYNDSFRRERLRKMHIVTLQLREWALIGTGSFGIMHAKYMSYTVSARQAYTRRRILVFGNSV
jgi:hypothetical protein